MGAFRPMCISPELIRTVRVFVRSLELAVLEVEQRPPVPLLASPLRVHGQLEILQPEVSVMFHLVHEFVRRQAPSSPLPPLRSIAHQRPFVATGCDEDIRAFATHSIFQSTQRTSSLSVVRSGEVVFRLEVRENLRALAPSSNRRIPFSERQLGWRGPPRAVVRCYQAMTPDIVLSVLAFGTEYVAISVRAEHDDRGHGLEWSRSGK